MCRRRMIEVVAAQLRDSVAHCAASGVQSPSPDSRMLAELHQAALQSAAGAGLDSNSTTEQRVAASPLGSLDGPAAASEAARLAERLGLGAHLAELDAVGHTTGQDSAWGDCALYTSNNPAVELLARTPGDRVQQCLLECAVFI